MSPLTSLLLVPATAYIVYAVVKFLHTVIWQPLQTQRFLNSQGLKGPPYAFLLGNAKQLLQFREEALTKPMPTLSHDIAHRVIPHISAWTKQYGKNFVFWIGPRAQMVLGDPDLVKEVLSNKNRIFSKSDLLSPYLQKIFGRGLAINEGEKWVKSMVPDMIASAEMMLERWMMNDGKEIEVHEEFRILSSEVISRTAFGSSFKEGQHIFGMLNELTKISDRNTFKMSIPIIRSGVEQIPRRGEGVDVSLLADDGSDEAVPAAGAVVGEERRGRDNAGGFHVRRQRVVAAVDVPGGEQLAAGVRRAGGARRGRGVAAAGSSAAVGVPRRAGDAGGIRWAAAADVLVVVIGFVVVVGTEDGGAQVPHTHIPLLPQSYPVGARRPPPAALDFATSGGDIKPLLYKYHFVRGIYKHQCN
ncbi:unnamed protein product [Linum tenue]|uniref:Cytochrome P450 n=1 Tax=Linum tenue TaxID=586396 RepID=A0AAV0NYC3_9ROSI|nr:unnamed protein product [Linum tenue]